MQDQGKLGFALLAFILLLMLASGVAFAEEKTAQTPLTPEQFKQALPDNHSEELTLDGFLALQKSGPVAILDVRSNESFAMLHIKGSINAPLTDLTEKNLPALVPDKNTPVVLVCDNSFFLTRRISMTMQAYPVLRASHYTHVYCLNLWQDAAHNKDRPMEEQEKAVAFEGTRAAPAPAPTDSKETPNPPTHSGM